MFRGGEDPDIQVTEMCVSTEVIGHERLFPSDTPYRHLRLPWQPIIQLNAYTLSDSYFMLAPISL